MERTETTRNNTKQHETSEYEIRWCLRGTHSAAALAIYFREVFLLKRAEVQRNKWNSAGTSETAVSPLERCLLYSGVRLQRWHIFIIILSVYWRTQWYPMPPCQSSLAHRLVLNQRTGQLNCTKYGLHWTTSNQIGGHGQQFILTLFSTNNENEFWKL